MRTQYSGSPERARRLLIERLLAAGWPDTEAETLVCQLVPPPPQQKPRWHTTRRALERKGSFTGAQFARVVQFYGCCLRCDRDDMTLVPDHIVPLSRGGAHTLSNIQPLCAPCNFWKGLRMIDYRVGRGRLS